MVRQPVRIAEEPQIMSGAIVEQDERLERVLITEAEIRNRVQELARQIARDFADHESICMIGVLKGAFVFMSDLGREIRRAGGPELRYDFIRAKAYGCDVKEGGETTREVRIDLLPDPVEGKDVLLVEDILDQGFTLACIRELLLKEQRAKSVKLCVLLKKELDSPTPEVREVRETLRPDYSGFTVPDRWVAGYGLDAGEDFRELPCVVVVREAYYLDREGETG